MADIKTVTLTGGEVQVTIERRHCHIRNLGNEMIYASLKPGIIPDADGVLGIPAGAKDVLTNTDGYVYLKGNGKVQLVGSEFASGILGGLAGGDITAAVAAAVAKIVAGAPADFDTLKEISDWITSHSESAAEMNSEIQDLKTDKANKTEIPTDYAKNKVLNTLEDVNNPDLESGIYSVESVPMSFPFGDTISVVLIVNKHRQSSGYGVQIGIPYFDGIPKGVYYREARAGTWSAWLNVADNGNADTLDGLHANQISSNPNLLTNPDFKINQREKTEYTANWGYSVTGPDRWNVQNGTIQITDDGITAKESVAQIGQYFEESYASRLYGQPATVSVITASGEIASQVFTFPDSHPAGVAFFPKAVTSNASEMFLYHADDASLPLCMILIINPADTIKAVKLELGSVATQFVPPDPATELLKCGSIKETPQILTSDRVWGDIPSNPNLLINPDFKINQRGKTEYNSFEYGVDRWHGDNSYGRLTVEENGVSIYIPSGARWFQTIEYLPAGTYVFSAKFKNTLDNVNLFLESPSGIFYIGGTTGIVSYRFTIDSAVKNAKFSLYNGALGEHLFAVEWVKLELGSLATPFVPPDQATELLKCQRYYIRLNFLNHQTIALLAVIDSWATCVITLPTVMRITPSISGDLNFVDVYDTRPLGPWTKYDIHGTMLTIGWSQSAATPHSSYVYAENDPTGYIEFNAEI